MGRRRTGDRTRRNLFHDALRCLEDAIIFAARGRLILIPVKPGPPDDYVPPETRMAGTGPGHDVESEAVTA